jgi:putative copper export protein
VLLRLVTAALFVGVTLVIGAVAYRLLILPRCGLDPASLQRAAWRAGRLGAAGAALVLWCVPARVIDQAQSLVFPGEAWTPMLRVVLHETPLGEMLIVQGLAALLAALALLLARTDILLAWFAAGLAAIALTLLPGLTGHAATAPSPALSIGASSVHVAAVGLWLGTVVYLWRDAAEPFAGPAVRAFHPVALAAASAVVLSGAVQLWGLVPSWTALVRSTWGAVLVVKFVVLAAILALGHHHWRHAESRIDAGQGSQVRRTLGVEVLLAIIILAVSGVLATTPPPE